MGESIEKSLDDRRKPKQPDKIIPLPLDPCNPFSGEYPDTSLLRCPVCCENYTHLTDLQNIESDSFTAWIGRGSCVVLRFICENGHKFEVRFGFHKGETYTYAKVIEND